ncbi:hypothetical protein FGB62_178g026 [Gracilaria domingensis]|nr:hypothetical protein FGB62_178g026 [Gracilaria domingensis]
MVVTAGRSTSANSLDSSILNSLKASQDDLDRLADALQSSLKELHSLQDSFETAVKKQQKALKAASKVCSAMSSRRRRRGRDAEEDVDNRAAAESESSESATGANDSQSTTHAGNWRIFRGMLLGINQCPLCPQERATIV